MTIIIRKFFYICDMKCDCDFCALKTIFFNTINSNELENYCNSKIQRSYKAKEIIIKQNEPIKEFLYLKEGLVKLYRDTVAGNQIISIGKPLDFVSLLSVFADEKYSYSISAIKDSVVCIMELSDIKKLILENGLFALRIITTVNKATDRILFDYLDNSQKRLYGRVANVIINFSELSGSNNFELPISRKEMAQLVGMSIENVIRTISDLRKDKIINVYGKDIQIIDIKRLKHIRDNS